MEQQFEVGDYVTVRPAADAWTCGVRFGTVVAGDSSQCTIWHESSGRTACVPNSLLELEHRPQPARYSGRAERLVDDHGAYWTGMVVCDDGYTATEWDECVLWEHFHVRQSAASKCAERAARRYARDDQMGARR